mgnify:CR=1 FL=1
MLSSPRNLLTIATMTLMCACAIDGNRTPAARPDREATPTTKVEKVRPSERIALSKLLKKTRADLGDMMRIYLAQGDAAHALGKLNASFQRRGYFRRVPSHPSVVALESNLRELARSNDLDLLAMRHQLEPKPTLKAVVLKPGERWKPAVEELRGVVRLEIDLKGESSRIASFIDQIVTRVEPLMLVTGDQTIPDGIKLFAETYYEHSLPQPRVHVRWPTLAQRLQEAGWDPKDPKLPTNPTYIALRNAIKTGRQRLPEVRETLNISADFPRWFLRRSFFEDRSVAAMSMRGHILLDTVAR